VDLVRHLPPALAAGGTRAALLTLARTSSTTLPAARHRTVAVLPVTLTRTMPGIVLTRSAKARLLAATLSLLRITGRTTSAALALVPTSRTTSIEISAATARLTNGEFWNLPLR